MPLATNPMRKNLVMPPCAPHQDFLHWQYGGDGCCMVKWGALERHAEPDRP